MKKMILLLLVIGLISVSATACVGPASIAEAGAVTLPGVIDENEDTDADFDPGLDPGEEIVGDGSDIIFDGELLLPGGVVSPDGCDEDSTDMVIAEYFSITGIIESIEVDRVTTITIEDTDGNPAVLVLNSGTIFPFESEFAVGDTVTGWYLTNMPMAMIWPPQYNISVLAVNTPDDAMIRVDRFVKWEDNTEDFLISQDKMFAFSTDDTTQITLANGGEFSVDDIEGRRIVVIYGISTRSIPEMATADRLIVLYEDPAVPG